jgi:hypothetical protein
MYCSYVVHLLIICVSILNLLPLTVIFMVGVVMISHNENGIQCMQNFQKGGQHLQGQKCGCLLDGTIVNRL